MKLNCEKDDICLIKAAAGPNVGRFVQCVRLIPNQLWNHADGTSGRAPTWELDGEVTAWNGARHRFCPDSHLQPLKRPGDDVVDARDVLLEQGASA